MSHGLFPVSPQAQITQTCLVLTLGYELLELETGPRLADPWIALKFIGHVKNKFSIVFKLLGNRIKHLFKNLKKLKKIKKLHFLLFFSINFFGSLILLVKTYFFTKVQIQSFKILGQIFSVLFYRFMNEILDGIKVLKLYAWEPSFANKIGDIRGEEVII